MPNQRPLKLLVISMLYEPDCVGIAAIASDMCAALAERGHEVTVFTTYPYYPEWKLKAKANPWRVQEEWLNKVRVRRHRIFVPSNPSRLLPRLIHELSFPVSLLRSLFYGDRYDVVMVYCPLLGSVLFASLRRLLIRETLWVNIQDIPVAAAKDSGIIRSGLLARLAAMFQRLVFNRADVWSSISPDMIQQLEVIKRADLPIHLCPNWLSDSLRNQIKQLASKLGRAPALPPKLLYCGTIGKKQGLLEFCQCLSKCPGDFKFQIRGAGSEAASVRRWVESSGDQRFDFNTLLPETEYVQAIEAADWFIAPQKSGAGCAFFPSRLMPPMSVGTPILAITERGGPLYEEVNENGLGLVIPWSRVDRLTDELDAIRADQARFTELQANCLRRAIAYDRDTAIDRLEALLWEHSRRSDSIPQESTRQSRSEKRVPVA